MDTFKKIYMALIGMTIISFIYFGLVITGVVNPNLADETQLYIFTTALYILIMSVIFSRAANVIANRRNRVVGYLSTVVGLVNLLLVALYMITHNDIINNIATVMTKINIFTLLMVLVFEIPQANSMHGKFQKVVAVIIAITYLFPYITGLQDFMENSTSLTDSTYSGFGYNSYEEEDPDKKNKETLETIQNVLTLVSVAGFIINPMLRVYYIDKDYISLNEMDETFETVTKYQANTSPNPNKVLSDKYKKEEIPNQQQVQQPPQQQPQPMPMPQPAVTEFQPIIEEMPREKVINQKFQEEVHPEAIIPTIDGLDTLEEAPNPLEAATQPEVVTEPVEKPVVENIPNPLEAAIQPESTSTTETTPVVENVPNPLEAAIQQPETNNQQ